MISFSAWSSCSCVIMSMLVLLDNGHPVSWHWHKSFSLSLYHVLATQGCKHFVSFRLLFSGILDCSNTTVGWRFYRRGLLVHALDCQASSCDASFWHRHLIECFYFLFMTSKMYLHACSVYISRKFKDFQIYFLQWWVMIDLFAICTKQKNSQATR